MANLNTKTFLQSLQGMVAAIQARSAGLLDFSVGSILRAISEATSGVVLWLQALILNVLALTRLSTSTGADADSFVADFGGPFVEGGIASFARLAAASSVGEVTFSRLSTTGVATVFPGAAVETADGTQRFVVVRDILAAAWDDGLQGYPMAEGIGSVIVPVAAVTPGSAGNVLPGTVTVITSAISGVDRVTNAEAMVGGRDTESDQAIRVRFRAYIRSLREATVEAVIYHAASVQAGVTILLVENFTIGGVEKRGYFYVVVDDGTGTPPQSLLDGVSAAVNAHRAAGVQAGVYAPEVVSVDVVANVTLRAGLSPEAEAAAYAEARAAIIAHLNAYPIGADGVFNRLYQVIYDGAPDVVAIPSLTLNGGTADITTTLAEVIKAGTVTVS